MTSGYPKEKRGALLQGMLFEVFFDPQAKLRSKIKAALFNELFDLRKHASLKDSFEFLAETLVASRGEFYTLPGRGHELAVTVATERVKDAYRVDAVYVDGADVLRPEGEEWAIDDEEGRLYSRKAAAELEEQLSQELVVPSRSLKITYTPPEAAEDELKVPLGYTVRKA